MDFIDAQDCRACFSGPGVVSGGEDLLRAAEEEAVGGVLFPPIDLLLELDLLSTPGFDEDEGKEEDPGVVGRPNQLRMSLILSASLAKLLLLLYYRCE